MQRLESAALPLYLTLPILKHFDIKILRSDFRKQSSSDSKRNDLQIKCKMEWIQTVERERKKRIILKMNFQGRVIVPLFLMFLEEAKPILAGAEMQTTG